LNWGQIDKNSGFDLYIYLFKREQEKKVVSMRMRISALKIKQTRKKNKYK